MKVFKNGRTYQNPSGNTKVLLSPGDKVGLQAGKDMTLRGLSSSHFLCNTHRFQAKENLGSGGGEEARN